MTASLGIDIGGTKILGVLRSDDGAVLAECRRSSPYDTEALLVEIDATIDELVRASSRDQIIGVGIGIAGMVTPDGRLRYGPNLPGVEEFDVRGEVHRRRGLSVLVDNDANVAGFAEVAQGAARGARHALVVTLGTGIGGAIIADGVIQRGAHGFAGEIGHWTVMRDGPRCACGELGHWEAIASGTALGRLAAAAVADGRLDLTPATVDGVSVGRAAAAGNPGALAVIDDYADNVAIGLAGLANILDPECIVIAGGVVELGPTLFRPLGAAFVRHLEGHEFRPPIPIVPAALGERAGAIGAAAMAAREFG